MSQKTARRARRAAKAKAPRPLKMLTEEQRALLDPQVRHVNAVRQQVMAAISALDTLCELMYPGFLKGGVEYNPDLGGFFPAGTKYAMPAQTPPARPAKKKAPRS